jgi:hypothetical protein
LRKFTETAERAFVIGAARTEILAAPPDWSNRFAEERAIVCHDAIEPALLDRLLRVVHRSQFRADDVPRLGTREVEEPQSLGATFKLLLRRTNLVDWLEQVTGAEGLAGVEGHVVQTRPGGDALDWHDDRNKPERALGVTISLTDTAYSGGAFEMRRVGEPASARTFQHSRPGTALIFDIGRDLEHRLLPLSSGGPRRVFAGWFLRDTNAAEPAA